MKKILVAFLASCMFSSPGLAADLYSGSSMCRLAGPAQLIAIDSNAELTDEVVRLMSEAVNVADSDEWIASRTPAFTWASEAKVACGKAYGYLQTNHRDDDWINKCECFHQRMVFYMY